jgi:uncharacterized protein (DUF849 family)
MMKRDKVIISCAITGAVHMPCMSPYLPVTPEAIAEESIKASEAGAAIVHLHARDPKDGFPTTDPDIYAEFLPVIKKNCNSIINITTGQPSRRAMEQRRPELAFEDRMSAPLRFAPEICSFNMGPINVGLWALADKFLDKATHEWERIFLTMSKSATILNTHEMMESIAKSMGDERGAVFEYECFDVGHLHTLKFIADQGWVNPPFFIQAVVGFAGGLAATPSSLIIMKQTADELFGDDYFFSCVAAGAPQMALSTQCAILGGNVRVGLEDSLWYGKGELAKSNADQVGRIRRILEELSLEIATPDEAREILGTKGPENTNIPG